MYCPIMPRQKSCSPPMKMITQMMEAHPSTGSSNISLRSTITIRARKETPVMLVPNQEAMVSGACEKLMIPLMAYLNSFQKFHLVSPATRSIFLYGSQRVLKPIHPKIPLEKRLYSLMETMASTILRFIRRKSLAPSTISASEILLIS